MKHVHAQNGFALPAAIGALVIVGVLVTGGFYVARQEVRTGVASKFAAMAVDVAQSGANDVIINHSTAFTKLALWGDTTLVDTLDAGIVSVDISRLASRLYFLDATATVTEGGPLWRGASRRIGVVTRLSSATIAPPAALTTQGVLKFGGSSEVHGLDQIPDGSSGGQADWTGTCDPATLSNKPGILINDTTNINWNGNRSHLEATMDGTPKFDEDPSLTFASLTTFGDLGWDDMAQLAEKVYAGNPGGIGPVVTSGVCNTAVQDNWGAPTDPTSPCFSYFPIIYASGSMQISGGLGQGILLVEGDLKVTGGAEFYGPVFVKGTLTTMGSGGHFWGGVVAANADLDTSTVLGDAVITYSSCAVERAVLNNSALTQVRALAMRSWVDLSNIAGS